MSTAAAPQSVLVLGGAGFIGSRIAAALASAGWRVTVLDGLIVGTGARPEHLAGLDGVRFIESRIEDFPGLPALITDHAVVVDCLAWTCHLLAIRDPLLDLDLNLRSHLHWLAQTPADWRGRIVSLGSRGQYGNPAGAEITEATPQVPEDIQGIHKAAAELHFRFHARRHGWPVASLRFPACVGPHQAVHGEDIGLFGGFIRDLLAGKNVELYGEGRRRAVVHVDDVAAVVLQLVGKSWEGFQAFNIAGHNIALEDALRLLVAMVGRGAYSVRPIPAEIRGIDLGGLPVSETRLAALLGAVPQRSLDVTLRSAVDYIRASLSTL